MAQSKSLIEKVSHQLETIESNSHCKTDFENMVVNMLDLVINLQKKDIEYGSSWKKRGGVGAFMMLARKWDRIENALKIPDTNESQDSIYRSIFEAAVYDRRKEGIIDDIRDLISYLMLVDNEIENRSLEKATLTKFQTVQKPHESQQNNDGSEPDKRYVFQD